MRHLALLLSFTGLTFAAGLPSPIPQTPAPASSSSAVVYITATNEQNFPITDLEPSDLIVKEDGKLRSVLAARPATATMQIVILVDDDGTGMFRHGLTGFAELMQEHAEISLRVVTGQVRTLVDYTNDPRAWMAAIAQLGVRPSTPDGGQLLEGVSEAAKQLKKREAIRPVIIALTVGGAEQSTLLSRDVLDQLHASRAALHVLFAESPAIRPMSQAAKPADLLEGNFNLSRVIGDGPKESGGRRRDVLATQMVPTAVQSIARELMMQYAVTYARDPAERAPRKLEISSKRRGIKVLAPTRAPAR